MRGVVKFFALAFAGGMAVLGATRADAMLMTQPGPAGQTLCVDVKGGATTLGTPILAYPCGGAINEQWYFVDSELQGLAPDRCLATQGNKRAAGTPMVLARCTGSAGQVWGYDDDWIYLLDTDLCLDAEPGAGQQLVINKCSTSAASQRWALH